MPKSPTTGLVPLGLLGRGLAFAALVGGGLGCSDPSPPVETDVGPRSQELQVSELEGLSFVPSGRTFIGSALDVGSPVDLLVDRYEVSSKLWTEWTKGPDPIPAVYRPAGARLDRRPTPTAWSLEVPAVGMTLAEARTFSEARGLRLLTYEEWLWCAVGPTCRRWPAGTRQRGFANTLDTELFRSTPVGAFESGKTPETAIYDMLGNVWEWIEPPPLRQRQWDVRNKVAYPRAAARNAPTWVLGGSFPTPDAPIYTRDEELLALALTTGHRSSEIGLRCCVDADVYLASLPGDRRLLTDHRRRLEAVGARWGVRATGLLDDLVEAQPQSAWLLALRSGAHEGSTR